MNYLSATLPNMPDTFKPARLRLAEAIAEAETATCAFYGIATTALNSCSRKDEVVMARHIVRYLLHMQGWGVRAIGRAIRKNHTQVSKSVRTVEGYVQQGGRVAGEVEEIRQTL